MGAQPASPSDRSGGATTNFPGLPPARPWAEEAERQGTRRRTRGTNARGRGASHAILASQSPTGRHGCLGLGSAVSHPQGFGRRSAGANHGSAISGTSRWCDSAGDRWAPPPPSPAPQPGRQTPRAVSTPKRAHHTSAGHARQTGISSRRLASGDHHGVPRSPRGAFPSCLSAYSQTAGVHSLGVVADCA